MYDDWSAHAAGRAWWLLRFHGHPDVRVLDGGWAAWVADGGAVETGRGAGRPSPATSRRGRATCPLVEADDVPGVRVLVDARAPERYRGETEPIDPVAGHIPGAVNVPTVAEPDRRRPVPVRRSELRALYAEVGATPEAGAAGEVAAYCGSGVTAVHDLLAMEVAGVRAALYPGSWSGWITDPGRAVEPGVTSGCP